MKKTAQEEAQGLTPEEYERQYGLQQAIQRIQEASAKDDQEAEQYLRAGGHRSAASRIAGGVVGSGTGALLGGLLAAAGLRGLGSLSKALPGVVKFMERPVLLGAPTSALVSAALPLTGAITGSIAGSHSRLPIPTGQNMARAVQEAYEQYPDEVAQLTGMTLDKQSALRNVPGDGPQPRKGPHMEQRVKIAQILSQVGPTLRTIVAENERLTGERDGLREKVASLEKEARLTKIAKLMEERGVNPGLTIEEKVASLRVEKDLDLVEKALEFRPAKTAGMSLAEEGGTSTREMAKEERDNWLLGE